MAHTTRAHSRQLPHPALRTSQQNASPPSAVALLPLCSMVLTGWSLPLLLLAVAGTVVLVRFGDVLLTLLLRKFAGSMLGPNVRIEWSLRRGVFEICDLELDKSVIPALEPLAGLPLDLDQVVLQRLRLELPLIEMLLRAWRRERMITPAPFLQISGLQLATSVNVAEKWMFTLDENKERYQESVKAAAAARIARVDYWTTTIIQKLKDLAAVRLAIQTAEKARAASSRKEAYASTAAVAAPSKLNVVYSAIDKLIDGFAMEMQSFALTIRDEFSGGGIGITFEKFAMGRRVAFEGRRKRVMQLVDYEMFVNCKPDQSDACYMIAPMTMDINILMPFIVQDVVMMQSPGPRALEIEIVLVKKETIVFQLRPAQLQLLMSLLRPISCYYDWQNRAMIEDELSCTDMTASEKDDYITLYRKQWAVDNEASLFKRMYVKYKMKEEIADRSKTITDLQSNTLAGQLIYLRSLALGWDIPSCNTPLPFTSVEERRKGELRRFLVNGLDKYESDIPTSPPFFHEFRFTYSMTQMEFQLREDSEAQIMTYFMNEFEFKFMYALSKVEDGEKAMVVDLDIARFGLLDERNVPTNVFNRLMDRDPHSDRMMSMHVFQLGNGHMDVNLDMSSITLLLIFDPLLFTTHAFVPALYEDEETQMRFLDCSSVSVPVSPEQREASKSLFVEDLPQEYSPLNLSGMSLCAKVTMKECEFCLLGDSASAKSHVLAFTSDMKIQVISSSRHEAIELELADVALQPCTIVMRNDGIDLEISGLRTILELEGDGVDLELGYRLTVGDPITSSAAKASSHAISSESAPAKSGSNLWALARSNTLKKKAAELAEAEVKKAEEPPLSRNSRQLRLTPGARRKIVMRMSDFGMNLAPNDLGVFYSILAGLTESMKEDAQVVKDREEQEARLAVAKRKLEERRHLESLKAEFRKRDIDGGGSLDVSEIEELLQSVVNCDDLTKDEFNATVREFISIVDSDGSGDISFEEFESALSRQKVVYPRLHQHVVGITGQEFVDPSMERSQVPYMTGSNATSLSNAAALAEFWTRYEDQIGTTRTTLKGIPPMAVQKKMVRTFKNFDYAQEAWNRLVNPSLLKPGEHSAWLLTKEMEMGSRGNVIDQLLSSLSNGSNDQVVSHSHAAPELRMFIHTVISTSFGGFYLRLVDEMLPMGLPALEISLEELAIYGNFSVWEGEQADATFDIHARNRAKNNFGVGKLSFDVYGKYYNTKARQIEPFMEFYQGVLDIKKEPESQLDVIYSSDRYFQLNLTSAFMEVVNTNVATFSKVERLAERERPHIKEEDGLFWMLNESGVNFKYYVVAKKQTKDTYRAETVSAVVVVPPSDAHPCVLLNVDDELKDYEEQSLKEKQLRQAFRNADADGSGELDTAEVRAVLREVYEQEDRQRRSRSNSSALRRSDSILTDEKEMDRAVEDFIALADTDASGLVSWEEFKIAISKSRETIDRYISIEIDGYQPLHDIPISFIGQTQIYELTPHFEDVESERSIEALYKQGIALLNAVDKPSRREMQKAYACLRRVINQDPNYEWVDDYYKECMRSYLPVLVAVDISVDGLLGLQVKVSGAESIRNGTTKKTECILYSEDGQVALQNPEQHGGEERYFELAANGSLSIPLNLVHAGEFAIRQVGETEWSNRLPLSVHEQRLYKRLTRFEQREAQKSQRDEASVSISATKMVSEKMGKNVALPDPQVYVPAGKVIRYPSSNYIDDQPTVVIEKISANNSDLGTWFIVIQPQLVLHNVLPCGLEYAIVQKRDCSDDLVDESLNFRISSSRASMRASRVSRPVNQIDYFEYVSEVNSRRMFVESGKNIQIFGLDLTSPALMKVRLCASESNRSGTWSAPFEVKLHADRKKFDGDQFDLRFDEGPSIMFQQDWPANGVRSMNFFAPYWIHNRSGLDLRVKLAKGSVCTIEQHRAYFRGAKDIPQMVNAPAMKALISVKPFQETARAHEGDSFVKMKKFLPHFEKMDWSEPKDMASVGYRGELRPSGDFSFVLSYETRAAPEPFSRSKIFTISPRFVVTSHIPRPLQVTPILLDKQGRSKKQFEVDKANCVLKEDESVAVYRFVGREKFLTGFRFRDVLRDETFEEMGEWSPTVPVAVGGENTSPAAKKVFESLKSGDFNIWTRGPLGDGPICSISAQVTEETYYVSINDVSEAPRFRIENRSTRHAVRYVQDGVKTAEPLVLQPLESHSYVWDDPLAESLKIKVTPVGWKIPTQVDFLTIGVVDKVSPNDVYAEVYLDGVTRVLAIGDTKCYFDVRQQAFLNDWLSNTHIDVSMHGVGITIVDGRPREILNITMENIRAESSAGSRKMEYTVHHVQLDDMTPHSAYPVFMAPIDSGFNSDKREGWLPEDGERPFMKLTVESAPQDGLTVINDFNLELQSMEVNVCLEYIFVLSNVLFQFIPGSDEDTILQQGINYKNEMLTLDIRVPDPQSPAGLLMYFKRWRMSDYDFHLVFDSVQEDEGEGISYLLGSTMGSIVGGIAHVTPEFHFDQILYKNRYINEYDLVWDVVMEIVTAVVWQWYKVVGSVELLGDPVGLATDIVDGFALAARQLKRDFKGKSLRKGESALTLMQTVVGAPLKAVSKVSNGLGDVVKKATDFKSQEDEEQPRHVPEGLLQSGLVFSKSIAYGVKGFVKEPYRGAKSGGVKGFAKGIGRGTMQLVASPVVGTLGVVEKMSQSVNNTTHLLDAKTYSGTRRPARDLSMNPLKMLSDSNLITEVEIHVLSVDGLPDNISTKVEVRVFNHEIEGPPKEIGHYKTSTVRHTSAPKFDQSWLVGITSLDTFMEINVYQKRKPVPKKRLGSLRFSVEEIYREFHSVPSRILADSQAKLRLKKRKRFPGSIMQELATLSARVVEVRDESWRQKIRQSSASVLADDADIDMDLPGDYDKDVEMLSASSLGQEESFPPEPRTFELIDSGSQATITLSIRYVNDMRR